MPGATRPKDWLLLQAGFRPFFLLAGAYGALAMVPWLLLLRAGVVFPVAGGGLAFHAHEMVFGVTLATVAGFLLTAVPNWTQSAPLRGPWLGALVATWLAGRAAMLASSVLPPTVVALVDLAFVPGLFLAVIPSLVRARNRRNYLFALLLALLFVANLVCHLSLIRAAPGELRFGVKLGAYVEVFMVALIGGRIVPAFTESALRRAGHAVAVTPRPRLQAFTLVLVALALLADLFAEGSDLATGLALVSGLLLTMRLVSFQGARATSEPIVLILHIGYGFVCVGLFALGASSLGGRLDPSTAFHAFTAGAIGIMMLAVMSRAALGHTGRPIVASSTVQLAYALVVGGAIFRVVGPLLFPGMRPSPVVVSGTLWALGYLIFTVAYFPILTRPRVDGRPG